MRLKRFFPAYLISFLMWIVASLPGEDLRRVQQFPENLWLRYLLSDSFMHFLTFGLLTLTICRGYEREARRPIPLVKVGILAFGDGLMMELYQGILPWRSFGLDDLLWNTKGVLFFLVLAKLSVGKWKSGPHYFFNCSRGGKSMFLCSKNN